MAGSIHSNKIRLLGHGSSTLPLAEDIRIVFLSILHPVHNTVVYAGLLFQDNGKALARIQAVNFVSLINLSALEKGDIKLYPYDSQTLLVQELHQYLMYVSECNRGGARRSLQVYTYSVKDKMALLRMHVNALSIPELRSKAEASLRVLFLERNLATVQDQHQDPSKVDFTVICVEQEMRSLFALPLPLLTEFSYIYKLFGGKKDVKSDEYLQTEYISEPSSSDQVLLNQIVALSELIDSVRKRIMDAIPVIRPGQQAYIKSRFRHLKPFKMIEPMQFNHPVFSKLAFLRLLTDSANSNDLQRGRYRSFGLLVPWKITITAIESTICEGVLTRGSIDRTMDDFNDSFADFFLVDLEDADQVEELLRFKDIHYASDHCNTINETLRSSNSNLFVVKLQPTDNEFGVRLTLPKDRELKLNYTYGLFQRFTDFTLSRSLDELKKVDQSPERSRNFLAALNGSLNTTESDSFNLSECWSPTDNNQLWVWGDDKELGVFMDLTPAHVRVLDNLRSYVMSLMIGPPGTGKSFFLAGLLLARLRHSRHTRQKTVIIVTANMHSAMDSILEKVTSLLSGACSQASSSVKKHIIRLAKSGDERLFKSVVKYVSPKSSPKLRKLIEKGEQVIILGTIWQLLRAHEVISDFNVDMLCVDESSMMPMIETTLAFSLTTNLAKLGSILLVGDHKQLGPVNKSNYNDDYCQEVEVITVEKSLFHHILSAQPAAPFASLSIPSATLTHTWRLNQTACYFVATYMQYDGYEPANGLIGSQRLAIRRTTALHHLERAARSLKRSLAVALHPAKSLVTIVLKSSKEGSNVVGREDLLECKFVSRMVQVLSNSTSLADDTNPRILTLVPHHKKRRLLKGEFSEGLTEPMTIYQAQGKECDICLVLYSMHDPSDIDRQREFIFSPFMFNVAITRARLKTIVVVTDHMLEAFPSALEDSIVEHGYKILRSFHDYCEEAGSVVNIELSDLVDQQDEFPVQQLRRLDVGS
ncbi:P-loop containing nucleoside triphosphate hydrolase protein [Paraphysoderma sedebokerense]|nr:P-loop containing nucleoside triphosphate hydrolase protein [Paraphysoderma sedebokerense]